MFAAFQFALERVQGAFSQPAAEIADEADGMGYVLERLESRAAFEVHQHEVYQVWVMRKRQADDQRAEQFAFARAGGACDDAMRAMRVVVEINPDGTIQTHTHRDTQASKGRLTPPLLDVDLVGVGYTQQIEQT